VLRRRPLVLDTFSHEELTKVSKDLLVSTFYTVGLMTFYKGQSVVYTEPLVDQSYSFGRKLRTRVCHEYVVSSVQDTV
jgi:hypothetical protein